MNQDELWVDIIEADAIKPGEHHVCIVDVHPVAVFNLQGDFYTIEDMCTHAALPLSEGPVEGDEIECPFHGARFCIKTGEVKAPPACVNLTTYETRVHQSIIQIKRHQK